MIKTINNKKELIEDIKTRLIKSLHLTNPDEYEDDIKNTVNKNLNIYKDLEYPMIVFNQDVFEEDSSLQKFQWEELSQKVHNYIYKCKLDRREYHGEDIKPFKRYRTELSSPGTNFWNLESYPRYKFISSSFESTYGYQSSEFIYMSITSELICNNDYYDSFEWLVSELSIVTKVTDPIFKELLPYIEIHDEGKILYKYYKYHDGKVSVTLEYYTDYHNNVKLHRTMEKDGSIKLTLFNGENKIENFTPDTIKELLSKTPSEDRKWWVFDDFVSTKRRLHELSRYHHSENNPYYRYFYDILYSGNHSFTLYFQVPSDKTYGHSEIENNYFEKDTGKEYYFKDSDRLECTTSHTWYDERFKLNNVSKDLLAKELERLNKFIETWLKYDCTDIKSIHLFNRSIFEVPYVFITCIWDLTKYKDKSYEEIMKITAPKLEYFRSWISKFWDTEVVEAFKKVTGIDGTKPWTQSFSIDCAPGMIRPGEYFKHICEHILHVPYYEPVSTFFGCWTWEVTFQNKEQHDAAYEYLERLGKVGAIR